MGAIYMQRTFFLAQAPRTKPVCDVTTLAGIPVITTPSTGQTAQAVNTSSGTEPSSGTARAIDIRPVSLFRSYV